MQYEGYTIVGDKTFGYKNIKPIGKGSVPLELRGSYTNDNFAKKSIDTYLSSKKAVINGKVSKSG